MVRHRLYTDKRSGFTLIELLIVVVIIGVLSTLGMWRTREIIPRMLTRQVARDFANDLEMARMRAIMDNREARLRVTDYDSNATSLSSAYAGAWVLELGNKKSASTSWSTIDNTAYDISAAGNQRTKNVSLSYTGGDLAGPTSCSCTDSVVFTPMGQVLNPATDFTSNGDISVSFVNKIGRSEGVVDDYMVRLYRSGMVRVASALSNVYTNDAGGVGLRTTY
jgi:prepilin-type N-terminal cleavage/methylation domain-containing protein